MAKHLARVDQPATLQKRSTTMVTKVNRQQRMAMTKTAAAADDNQ